MFGALPKEYGFNQGYFNANAHSTGLDTSILRICWLRISGNFEWADSIPLASQFLRPLRYQVSFFHPRKAHLYTTNPEYQKESTMLDETSAPLLGRYSEDSQDFGTQPDYQKSNLRPSRRLSSLLHAFATRPLGIRRRKQLSKKKRVLIASFNGVLVTILLLITISILDGLSGFISPSYGSPPAHYKAVAKRVRANSDVGRGNPRNEKVFIASNIIQADLIEGHWGTSLIDLIDLLGPENVFVSIYENDSGNSSVRALSNLASRLRCEYTTNVFRL
jgi:hypothetical protein